MPVELMVTRPKFQQLILPTMLSGATLPWSIYLPTLVLIAQVILQRDALLYSAKCGLAIACRLSIRLSVRLSVTLVNRHDHIG